MSNTTNISLRTLGAMITPQGPRFKSAEKSFTHIYTYIKLELNFYLV